MLKGNAEVGSTRAGVPKSCEAFGDSEPEGLTMLGRHLNRTIAVSMCVVSLHGCGDTTFLRYSQNLSDKAQGSSAKVQKFYSALQSEHSQMRLDEVKMQAEAATPLDPATPGPICPFTTDEVDSRVKSARFIELYSVKFNELVRKRNANEMQQAISDLSGQLTVKIPR